MCRYWLHWMKQVVVCSCWAIIQTGLVLSNHNIIILKSFQENNPLSICVQLLQLGIKSAVCVNLKHLRTNALLFLFLREFQKVKFCSQLSSNWFFVGIIFKDILSFFDIIICLLNAFSLLDSYVQPNYYHIVLQSASQRVLVMMPFWLAAEAAVPLCTFRCLHPFSTTANLR